MDNGETSTTDNVDQTDRQSQSGKKSIDNGSRRSSRVASARSDRSKAISGPEATAIDETNPRKASSNASRSPKLDGHRQSSAAIKQKPSTPTAPVVDGLSGDFNDDLETDNEIQEIVSCLSSNGEKEIVCFFSFVSSI